MGYNLWWKQEAEKEFDDLDNTIRKEAFTQFKKLREFPQLGKPLGKKAGMDLTGYRKLYFFGKKYRIVYKIDEKNKKVIIFGIDKRDDMKVYREVIERLKKRY